jgi:cell division protein FtsB
MRGSRGKRREGAAPTQRLPGGEGYKRRLQVIEGGRRESERSRSKGRELPARDKREISRRIRRRRRLAAAVLALLAAGLIAYLLTGPIMRTIESRRVLSRTESELEQEKNLTQALQERKDRALTIDFVEEEARKMGYVKPGEIPIIVLGEEEEEHTLNHDAASELTPESNP